MSETIFHLDNDGNLIELNESSYISEDLLQKLLADYPNLISGSQIHSLRPRRWLLISREFGIPDEKEVNNRWSLDHLFIDQDGIPTLVEVKRSTDTRIRREVIGQILDYAANAVTYWTIEEIVHRFEEQCKQLSKDINSTIDEFLQGEYDANAFWELTKTNLKAGKIRMLIVSDTIPKELQRIIEFLNEQMTPAEILGVQIKQFTGHENVRTLVPRVIGQTASADNNKGIYKRNGANWNEDTYFQEFFNQRGHNETKIARRLLNWANPYVTRVWYGAGKKYGSLVPILNWNGSDNQLFALWTNGNIEIYFQWYKNKPPFDSESKRLELLERLNDINGVNIGKEKISLRPSFPIKVLDDDKEFQKFIDAYYWFINEVKMYS